MWGKKRTGSVVCRSCGRLVGVSDDKCFHCGAMSPSLFGLAPWLRRLPFDVGLTELAAGVAMALYAATLLVDPDGIGMKGLGFLAPSQYSLYAFGASGSYPVLAEGRWWTLLSAGWLHGSALHIFFNVMWMRNLLPEVIHIYGGARAAILYTLSSVAGFALSTFTPILPAQLSVGASAPVFGLMGALIYYGRRYGSSRMTTEIWGWALFLFAWGLIGRGTDNWAHLGGFAGGWLLGHLLNPMKPERTNHVLLALACLLATVGALVASFVLRLPR